MNVPNASAHTSTLQTIHDEITAVSFYANDRSVTLSWMLGLHQQNTFNPCLRRN